MSKPLDDFLEAFLGDFVTPELRERLALLEIPDVDEAGYDPFGLYRPLLPYAALLPKFFYEFWNNVSVYGVEHVPPSGAGIVIANHSGALPWDALSIAAALIVEAPAPRLLRPLIARRVAEMPFFSTFFARCGGVVGLMENALPLLASGQLLLIFPEGVAGITKPYSQRYRLQPFSVGFVELAVRQRAPIIPVAVIGAEEQSLTLFNWGWAARRLGLPGFPITPFFPLLGPLGLLPLPSKYRIYFGTPIHLDHFRDEWLEDPDRLHAEVERIRALMQEMIDAGLEKRPLPFL